MYTSCTIWYNLDTPPAVPLKIEATMIQYYNAWVYQRRRHACNFHKLTCSRCMGFRRRRLKSIHFTGSASHCVMKHVSQQSINFWSTFLATLILRLHCHWKPSQSGTVLKIVPCWPLTGSVYIAIIKAVRVLSIFDLKGGTSGKRIT